MSLKIFLSIIAFLGVVHGVAFLIAPEQLAALYGMPASAPVVLMGRFFGGALIAWCAILWSARSFRDESAVRAVLLSTSVAEAIGVFTAIAGTITGTLNAMGWIAVLIYLFGTVGCAYFAMCKKELVAVRY
jgi:hypothetical protein